MGYLHVIKLTQNKIDGQVTLRKQFRAVDIERIWFV